MSYINITFRYFFVYIHQFAQFQHFQYISVISIQFGPLWSFWSNLVNFFFSSSRWKVYTYYLNIVNITLMQNLGLNKEENDTLPRFQPPIPELESKATVTIIVCGLYYYFTSYINNNIDQFPNNTAHSLSLTLCLCWEHNMDCLSMQISPSPLSSSIPNLQVIPHTHYLKTQQQKNSYSSVVFKYLVNISTNIKVRVFVVWITCLLSFLYTNKEKTRAKKYMKT